jgi:hypothetical protein
MVDGAFDGARTATAKSAQNRLCPDEAGHRRHWNVLQEPVDYAPTPDQAAADFGFRPRRATATPGMPPAHPSQRSACFAPRRASVNVTRITAPFPSTTSPPHLSQTRTVFRAILLSLVFVSYGKPTLNKVEIGHKEQPSIFGFH